jgi:hypothetical protein
MKQCVVTSGFSYFERETKPVMEPTIDGAPSVQMPSQFSEDRPYVSSHEDKPLKYILPFACLGQLFATEIVFVNFTIIFKSYKFCNINFIGEIC